MDGESLLEKIVEAAWDDPMRGVPYLIGPTQVGKTFFLRRMMEKWLRERGHEPRVAWWNPQCDLPEDAAGWPYRRDGFLHFTPPPLVPKEWIKAGYMYGVIIDEADKAQDSTLSTMLTLLNPAERRLRNFYLPTGAPVAVAMNEPRRPLPEPLLARGLFLPFPPPGAKILERDDLRPLSHVLAGMYDDIPVKFPARPRQAPGAAHKLARWLDVPEFWQELAFRDLVVRGLFCEAEATVILARLKERPVMTSEAARKWAEQVSPADLLGGIIDILNALEKPADRAEVLTALVARCKSDLTGEFTRQLEKFLKCQTALFAVGRPEWVERGKKALGVGK